MDHINVLNMVIYMITSINAEKITWQTTRVQFSGKECIWCEQSPGLTPTPHPAQTLIRQYTQQKSNTHSW